MLSQLCELLQRGKAGKLSWFTLAHLTISVTMTALTVGMAMGKGKENLLLRVNQLEEQVALFETRYQQNHIFLRKEMGGCYTTKEAKVQVKALEKAFDGLSGRLGRFESHCLAR